MRYIAKYCNKEDFEYQGALHNKVYPTFHLISKGLGINWITTYKDFILKRHCQSTDHWIDDVLNRSRVDINGYKYALPRYYKTKLYGQKTLLSVRVADKLAARNDELFAQQLQELQAQNPSDSAFRILDNENRRFSAEKFEKYSHQQSNFYNKSQL